MLGKLNPRLVYEMTDEITIPPFPKMGGHGGEPAPGKMGGHGGEPTSDDLKTEQEELIKKGLVSRDLNYKKLVKWWPPDLKITIRKNTDGSVDAISNKSKKKEPASKATSSLKKKK